MYKMYARVGVSCRISTLSTAATYVAGALLAAWFWRHVKTPSQVIASRQDTIANQQAKLTTLEVSTPAPTRLASSQPLCRSLRSRRKAARRRTTSQTSRPSSWTRTRTSQTRSQRGRYPGVAAPTKVEARSRGKTRRCRKRSPPPPPSACLAMASSSSAESASTTSYASLFAEEEEAGRKALRERNAGESAAIR